MDALKMPDLTGQNAIIFAATSSDMGLFLAETFAKCGANVALSSRHEQKLIDSCAALKEATGKEFRYYLSDAIDTADVEATVKRANDEMGKISIIVNLKAQK